VYRVLLDDGDGYGVGLRLSHFYKKRLR